MRNHLYRVSFLVIFFLLLWIKEPYFLAIAALMLWGISFKKVLKINKKVIKSILFFNLGVSLGYIIMGFVKDINPLYFIIYINLKVYVLTYFVFWFFERVNIVEFLSFSKDLSYLLMISLSQIISYKKSYEEFKLAYKARVIKKLRDREKKFILRVFEFFLSKALSDSKERTLAMKARGFF